MLDELVKFIFLFLVGTTVLNFCIALVARLKTGHKEFNTLVFYWVSLFFTFAAAAALSKSPTQIAFAYFSQFIPTLLIASILSKSRNLAFPWKAYCAFQVLGMATTTYLLLSTSVGFTISLLPVTFTTTYPLWSPLWDTLIRSSKHSNWIEKGMGVLFISGIVNHFNYALFRLDESTAFWGWSISIAQYQCLSIFLPMLTNHRQEESERRRLEFTLEKLSGQSVFTHSKVDGLYRELEFQIHQNESALDNLKSANISLEEEREINEILIKTVSHDLANPMSVIKLCLDLFSMGRIKNVEEESKILAHMGQNVKSALNMISRIRQAIVDRNQAALTRMENVNLDNILVRTELLFKDKLLEKNIKFIVSGKLGPETRIKAEENALVEHILANIISNAIKFSYRESEIHLNIVERAKAVELEIRDFGTGIKQKTSNDILFSEPGTEGEKGTGFGLVIMNYFVKQFGAEVKVVSHTQAGEKGTSVYLSLVKSSEISISRNVNNNLISANNEGQNQVFQ